MKAMLSQPMNGKTEEEIAATRERVTAMLESKGYEIVNTLFTDEWCNYESWKKSGGKSRPLMLLAHSLLAMSFCDLAYFCEGWEHARGCRLEHAVAVAYGLTIIVEDETPWKPSIMP